MNRRACSSLTAAALIACFLWLLALVVMPEAHEHVHSDAGDEDHECAVVLLLNGGCEPVAISTPLLRAAVEHVSMRLVPQPFLRPAGCLEMLRMVHGPPALG